MSFDIYQASVPVFTRFLTNLSAILAKAEVALPSLDMNDARLAPDMLPLPRQIQIASDAAKGAGARLAQVEIPAFEDTETTYAELQERIRKTIAFLDGLDPAAFEGAEGRDVTVKMRTGELNFRGDAYLTGFALPNFFFHVTTAYAILRHNGLEIGKKDYLGG